MRIAHPYHFRRRISALLLLSCAQSIWAPAPSSAKTIDELIGQSLAKNYQALHGCFRKALAESRHKAGTIFLKITLGNEDSVRAVAIERDELKHQATSACIQNWIQGFTFQGISALGVEPGSQISIPLTFRAAPEQFIIDANDLEEVRLETNAEAKVLLQPKNVGALRASLALLKIKGCFEVKSQPGVSQGIYLLAGKGWYTVDKRQVPFIPQTALYLSAGCGITLSGELQLLQVFVPAGAEARYLIGKTPAGNQPCKPLAVKLKNVRPIKLKGGALQVTPLLSSRTIKGPPFYLGLIEIKAGLVLPKHTHATSAELVYLLSGKGQTSSAGVEQTITADQAAYYADGKEHNLAVLETLRALQVFAPAGPEDKYLKP